MKLIGFRDRTAVLALSMVLMHDGTEGMQKRAAAFLVHLAILKHFPLATRPTKLTETSSTATPEAALLDRRFMCLFCDAATSLLDPGLQSERSDTGVCDIYDLVDGRIWASVLQMMPQVFPSGQSMVTFKSLEAQLHQITGILLLPFVSMPNDTSAPHSVSAKPVSSQNVGSLLAFSQPDFESLLKDVAIDAIADEDDGQDDELPSAFRSNPFKDDSHWHSTRKIVVRPGQSGISDAKREKLRMRKDQLLRSRLLNYAASLTNAVGKVLEPETIVVSKTPEPNGSSRAPKDNKTVKPDKPQRGKNSSKSAEIIRQREKRTQDTKRSKTIADWGSTFDRLQREPDILKRYKLLSDHIARLPGTSKSIIGPDAHLFACSAIGEQLSRDDSHLKPIGKIDHY